MADLREATLEDLLSDPVIQAVMASDGVRADDIRQLMKQVSTRSRRHCDVSQPIREATSAQPTGTFLRQLARGRMKKDARAIFGTMPFGNTLPLLRFADKVMRNLPQRD